MATKWDPIKRKFINVTSELSVNGSASQDGSKIVNPNEALHERDGVKLGGEVNAAPVPEPVVPAQQPTENAASLVTNDITGGIQPKITTEADIKAYEAAKAEAAAKKAEDDELRRRLGSSYDGIMSDEQRKADFMSMYKNGAWQAYADAKRKQATDEQRKKNEKWHLMNEGAAAFSQLGSAIGNMVTASKGPIGGAVEQGDYMTGAVADEEAARKKYTDQINAVKEAGDKYDDMLQKASVYSYTNAAKRAELERKAKLEQDKLNETKRKNDLDHNKWVAENARKDKELAKKLDLYDSQIKKNQAAAAKSKTDEKNGRKGTWTMIKIGSDANGIGGKEVWLPNHKWANSTENISKAYSLLSDEAKKSIADHIKSLKSGSGNSFNNEFFGNSVNIDMSDYATRDYMRDAIGQWIGKEGCEAATNFVLGLLNDDEIKEVKDFTGDDDSRTFK